MLSEENLWCARRRTGLLGRRIQGPKCGAPIGHLAFVAAQLSVVAGHQATLLQRNPIDARLAVSLVVARPLRRRGPPAFSEWSTQKQLSNMPLCMMKGCGLACANCWTPTLCDNVAKQCATLRLGRDGLVLAKRHAAEQTHFRRQRSQPHSALHRRTTSQDTHEARGRASPTGVRKGFDPKGVLVQGPPLNQRGACLLRPILKAGDAPHEGLLKSKGGGLGV